jgi:integrase
MSSVSTNPNHDGWEAPSPGDWDYRAVGPIKFDRFVDELLALYEYPLRAKGTRDKLKFTLKILAGLLGPDGTTAGLDPALVARFLASRPPGESPHTTKGLLANVRSACSYAKSQGYARSSPFDFRKCRSWLRVGQPIGKKHHSQADILRVLNLLASEIEGSTGWARWRARRLYALVATVAYTGLRRDEALRLHADDVDFGVRMILLVERSRRMKTESSAQPVPMPAALIPILENWLAYRMDVPEGRLQSPSDCPFLFPGVTRKNAWTGGPPGHRPIDQVKAAGERAGVQGFTFLSLRHSYATHAESWGLSPAMIQRVLRHTTMKTQNHYRHADVDNMRAAVDGIGFGTPPPPAPAPAPTPTPAVESDPEGGLYHGA